MEDEPEDYEDGGNDEVLNVVGKHQRKPIGGGGEARLRKRKVNTKGRLQSPYSNPWPYLTQGQTLKLLALTKPSP